MIIDSHAHYSYYLFEGRYKYLDYTEDGYTIAEGTREELFDRMAQRGIGYFIEPAISLESNGKVISLCSEYPSMVSCSVGVHPTRTSALRWKDRRQLPPLLDSDGVVAIGETGLDYHQDREEQHRLVQLRWFLYQLKLANKKHLPLILHIRDAHKHALAILSRYSGRKYGGVVHCYASDSETAQRYVALGYHIGIGGTLLGVGERAELLREAVRDVPLERILVETDSPYVFPDTTRDIEKGKMKKVRNTSLILPAVIEEIARIKGVSVERVERITAENAIKLFSLSINNK